ncbi:hypothetical protein [Pseudodesulfovibrio piezophilus]|uniref:Uncharacterized protein n=1 Tax=Pseudodesulfovibrio piezophilus (strain DSM 21447 / JCM 15486 / C1TLV30) TaxID=1322246 RepID=M1WXB2_PSEP2|nr:hypothetical protein [Pseudodesulfovibrio piezophilus]CCH49633.1 conserved protein of unknown function [Pseudodesulfovibrio piezophilus C1TLV30]
MTAMEREDLQDLLIRIDERVKTIQEDIREINLARRCASHHVKISTLEKMVWGCMATVGGVGARVIYEILK